MATEGVSQTSSEISFNLGVTNTTSKGTYALKGEDWGTSSQSDFKVGKESMKGLRRSDKMKYMRKRLQHDNSTSLEHVDIVSEQGNEENPKEKVDMHRSANSIDVHSIEEEQRTTSETGEHDKSQHEEPSSKTTVATNDVKLLQSFKDRLEEDDKTVFYDMFELMITKMSCIESNLEEVKAEQVEINGKIDQMETVMASYEHSINEMGDDVAEVADMNIKLVQATVKCDENFKIVASKVKNLATSISII